jgi:AraC-like DNA-binding protein
VVGRFELGARYRFATHRHATHQLAWASRGVLTMAVGDATWVLPPSRALWVPAGLPHDVLAHGDTTMLGAYFEPARCALDWAEPTVVDTTGLLGHLIEYLAGDLPAAARRRAEAVFFDVVRPMPVAHLVVPAPSDERAARVAACLRANPADDRSLDDWGRQVGASGRTLARVIERETGMGFARWRTQQRIAAALPRLATGASVNRVAHEVGYATASAFVAAFRRTVGTSPGAYFSGTRPG